MISAGARSIILLLYFIGICILFFLPGNAFPKAGSWMAAIHFDKWVHFGLFLLLCFLSCWAVQAKCSNTMMFILAAAVLYGIVVEWVQHQFIANRSFDVGDWAADAAGSVAGILAWRVYKKNRPL